ncbi:pyruvate/2-oxoglutarate dehydrogenase complex, dehydrogenase component beta subunit [Owenweeksia hongkongensis DSM 17368]|uniref:3-methyl-2-oxobutanoate dehydrogenase (2-methylpropanoyl-transferring) n=1 Tax=Owenweeksia hongkongensis (strain DSM 17368 / CIP 108786 / JCM 12287 / NRRL B-23963 / UST20020801) TaxID=926562 RepID=G8R3E4_OWEHD|nr:thiamine pyrophosphate-dependent enzyme [Owenweeksia hongkongensis]AEV31965.1 pyruvate/2-oxoglutarate dehydrogenase complex, dehydrogenase component beta subunit [Owenweeksia hongkongensis DSM 17368]
MSDTRTQSDKQLTFEEFKEGVINDYKLAIESREASLIGRREVLTGKAKFGIFGDGKEVAQIAWSKVFKNGDFRAGYYRDQTFMMAIGQLTTQQFFASLYADTNHENEPASAGRQMNGHFTTQSLDENGNWKDLTAQKNSSADISPTAGQMPRLLGLAEASKVYRENKDLKDFTNFSKNGNEIAWGTIGNASTSEGLFFETFNAAGVLQVPMVISVWDDDYGISVHAKYQTTKENISEILKGFQKDEDTNGFEILNVKGWDYPSLVETYEKAEKIAREQHVPVLIHVNEITQPQGHSTSGSHERYKNEQRLKWEQEFDCIKKMREWMIMSAVATEEELVDIEKAAKKVAREAKTAAWSNFINPIKEEVNTVVGMIEAAAAKSSNSEEISAMAATLKSTMDPLRKDAISAARRAVWALRNDGDASAELKNWLEAENVKNKDRYNDYLYSQSDLSPLRIEEVAPIYSDDSKEVDARIILKENFDRLLTEKPEVLIFGEDSGKIGDVNQGLEGLQEKHGEGRVFDTGIREATIMGQGIGMAMRGLRPIAEIQYLDYLLYALQIMSDDLATVHYRTKGRQKAPVVIRTRGHRLEGVWHSGSPMGSIINTVRGVHVLVPRNMTKAAGFYNTMLESDDPALIVECLNGYRLKERTPDNLSEIRTPLGVVETIREGSDLTLVTYGSSCRIAMDAANLLEEMGIDMQVIDVQSLLPFDRNHDIVKSLANTNRLVVMDEDVPGGASAFIMQQVLEEQGGYKHLDSKPLSITAKAHRPAYGTDGDYFSKPSADDIVEQVYAMMHEADPTRFPAI